MTLNLFNYQNKISFIHKLSGLSKLIAFLALTITVMISFDIRVISFVFLFSLIIFYLSKIKFQQVKIMFYYVWLFITLNFILTYLFAPTLGNDIYQSYTLLFKFNNYFVVTLEQLFYMTTKALKYLAVVPIGMIFILTTDPSELASSMNRIGLPYKICYVISLTLRYFPDVYSDYRTISLQSQARGIELSKKASIKQRFIKIIQIITPLIFSTVDRIDVISRAMDLRGFSKNKKRTWYSSSKLKRNDYLSIIITVLILIISIYIRVAINKSVYFNPFN